MEQVDGGSNSDIKPILERLDVLEKRMVKIESLMSLEWVGERGSEETVIQKSENSSADQAESTIVEYGLAWIGSIVLFLGIVFLTSYFSSKGYPVSSTILGFVTGFIILGIAYKWSSTLPILSKVLVLCSTVLIYYLTLGLYFYNTNPLINSKAAVVTLALLVIAGQFYYAIRKGSDRQAILGAILLVSTSIIADSTPISLGILVITSFIAVALLFYNGWWRLTVSSILLVYFAHLIWLLGDPLVGNELRLVSSGQNSIYFLFTYATIYALSILVPRETIARDSIIVAVTILNAALFSLLLLITVPTLYADYYAIIFTSIAVACLALSVYLKINPVRQFAPATYASFGFAALSVAIYGFWGLPDAYFIFALQSFFVVLIALWYRSQIIVVINVFLFIVILLAYLISSDSINSINFVLSFTALATARIINWKKERLTLKTEVYRNIYLFIGISMLLYSLAMAVPSNYVTIAWSITAIILFALGIWLKNVKYRYLAIFTIIAAAIHIFLIDLANMEIGYRVIALLAVAVISIGLSLYYTKRIRKT